MSPRPKHGTDLRPQFAIRSDTVRSEVIPKSASYSRRIRVQSSGWLQQTLKTTLASAASWACCFLTNWLHRPSAPAHYAP
jgi:hypothetical protein